MKPVKAKKKTLLRFLRYGWRKSFHMIRNLRGEPEQIAWGGAIGTFISVTPTFGIQTILAFFVATLFKANRIVSVAFVYITNVFTVIPVYFFTGWVGIKILSRNVHQESFYQGMKIAFHNLGAGRWGPAYDFFLRYFLALWIGALVVGIIGGIAAYVFLYYSSKSYYKLRKKRLELRREKKKEKKEEKKEAQDLSQVQGQESETGESIEIEGAGGDTSDNSDLAGTANTKPDNSK